MKKILLTVVLGIAVVGAAQDAAKPAQPAAAPAQPAAAPAPAPAQTPAAPVIKDPAEYNAYVSAVDPQKDANARISGLEAFLTQYPNSIMKNQALEILMQTYQQTNNVKKTMETGTKIVTADPCQVRALTLLSYFDRVLAQSAAAGDPNAKQELADGRKYGQQGLDCLAKASDPDILKIKDQMTGIFNASIGISAYTDGDYATASQTLRKAVDTSPDTQKDFSLVYPLALAYLKSTPPDYQNGIWFAARAAAMAPTVNEPGIEKYARSQYVKFHAGDDGWADLLAAAKAGGAQVAIRPAPTPAEQVHAMVASKKPEEMNFAEWQFVFTNGAQEDQDLVWNAIKGKAVQMNGTVIGTTSSEFQIAGSSDDIDAKKADITLKFEEKIPVKLIPKDGASFDFQGEPASYTPNPFMMVMEKGQLLRAKAATPAKKAPVAHKKPAAAAQ